MSLGSPAGPTLRDLKTKNKRALGTSAELEKSYLRLTSAPEAAKVRPPAVLKEALALVKRKWRERRDYEHAKEQLKAIRQDLTVQHARRRVRAERVRDTRENRAGGGRHGGVQSVSDGTPRASRQAKDAREAASVARRGVVLGGSFAD